jgi:hypothetical protein
MQFYHYCLAQDFQLDGAEFHQLQFSSAALHFIWRIDKEQRQ